MAYPQSIFAYILMHKLRFFAFLFLLFLSTVMSGVSFSLVIPLVDKVFMVQNQKTVPLFELKQSEQPLPLRDRLENRLKTVANMALKDKTPMEVLKFVAWLLVALLLLKGLVFFSKEYVKDDLGHLVVKDVRDDLYSHLHRLSLDFYTKFRVGDVSARLTADAAWVQEAVSMGYGQIAFECLNLLLFASLALYLHWKLAIFALVVLPLMVIPIIYLGRKVRKISLKTQEKMGEMSVILQETFVGAKVVKAFSMEEYEKKRFFQETGRFYRMAMKSVKRKAALSPLMEVVVALSGAFFLIYAGQEVLSGRLSTGQFSLFVISVLSLLRPFKKIGRSYNRIQQAKAAFRRLQDVFEQVPSVQEVQNPHRLSSFEQSIQFCDLTVAYDPSEPVLQGIDLQVQKGEMVAFVGPSGSGKSSLLNLLPRFYDPLSGKILVDGHDLKELALNDLRGMIGLVSQDVVLFHDTVAANIAYGSLEVSAEDIENAARAANAHEFINKLPEGYQTIVGEKGLRLSGGERQRLAIARAVLKNPQILILDEATSALDSESEKAVQEALDHLMQGRTVLAVAHRLSTVRHAHRIYVVENGGISQEGRHEDLLKEGGKYRQLYELQ